MNENGSALAEALPAVAALLVFVAGILLSVYLIFARAWMQYQAEQALYCLGEARPTYICRRTLERKLSVALPWGRPGSLRLSSSPRGEHGKWNVEVEWKIRNFRLNVRKELSVRRILQNRALRW